MSFFSFEESSLLGNLRWRANGCRREELQTSHDAGAVEPIPEPPFDRSEFGIDIWYGIRQMHFALAAARLDLWFVTSRVNAGLTLLVSLNVSNSRVTSAGLQHLKPLKNLRVLVLESCEVTADDMRKLQSTELPELVSFRPE